ncbi:uncharacterized protein LOC124173050 [Ischnura elegans]|uniref:uncharacterized protein LOC124173050 n=1 Tax=Ischnura elegans TaxID=197161 RepID=UPI001ED8AFAE|nr:uncharacterized protein LOC124173050 [Ischnura elegans]XP_046408528.1 uncharacterized protein LOC124173050 [Ischnura elegans]
MKSLVRQLSSSLKELKDQVCGRDALLRCLEESVTSTAEDLTAVNVGLGGAAFLSQPTTDPARARQECVDAMMRKTRIVYGSGVDYMHRLYERLYDEDEITACIIKYLCGNDRVKVMVDFESQNIGRMKEKVVCLDGTQWTGSRWYSFFDFESETVYLGAKDCPGDSENVVSARLAVALSQLSLKLAFDNEGRPYSRGDVEQEREWVRALEEVEGRRKRGGEFRWSIHHALDLRTQSARVNYFAAAVPWIITNHGSTDGRANLLQEASILLHLYSNNVMGTLLSKAKR